jgi:P pilus assembly chaperone PapD
MWYLANNAANTGQIGHATSSDGMTFTKDPANPVLGPGAGASWDNTSIDGFALLRRPWSGDYIMAYAGNNGAPNGIGIATSPDGSVWNKHAANPVLGLGGAGTWNQTSVAPFILTYDGSMYKLNLTGSDAGGLIHAGEALSLDGIIWFPNVTNPIISPSPGPFWDDGLTIKGNDYLEGNNLRTFYFGAGTSNGMGTATTNPYYYGGGWLESSVFSPGTTADWGTVTWDETVPAGTGIQVRVRCGDVPVPDGTWTGWTAVPNGGTVPHANSRYIQYRVDLNGPTTTTPELSNLAIDFEALPSMWYFAEGYTGSGFDQWITIQNPNAADAAVTVTYYTPTGPPVVTNHNVPGQTRQTIYVNTDLGPDLENSCDIASTQPVIIERPMYFDYQGLGAHGWQGGHVSLGSTGLSRNWYFAEGYTGNSFEEWLTVQNPNPAWATLDVTYYVTGAAPIERQHLVGPTSRYTINVNQDAGADLEVSTAVRADQPILCERPMYFAYQGYMEGGHIVMGSPHLATDWYLAEGATFPPFTEYITVQNPNAAPANLAVTYFTPGTPPIVRNHTVPARSRYTINAGADSGQSSDLSTHVNSDQPILVERPMYFDMAFGTLPGGHAAMGVNAPATQWYFGEGYTGAGFDEWLTVQNPNAVVANLTVTYYTPTGAPIVRNHPVQPQSRYTIPVDVDAGENLEVSTYVLSDQPVICERPMYFFYQGYHSYNWPGGHDSPGFAP